MRSTLVIFKVPTYMMLQNNCKTFLFIADFKEKLHT